MWAIENHTPYRAERTWVRDKDGRHHWIVVVKATYDIFADGTLGLSEMPVEPLHAPEYSGIPGQSSLRYEADLVALKPGTDVYLNATAYAPYGKPCKEVNVSIRIESLYKELTVYGDRIWEDTMFGGIAPSSPKPFLSMPICYERAFGGCDYQSSNPQMHRMDLRNPVGTGVVCNERNLVGKAATNLEARGRKPGQGEPAGFGAIASFWSPRRELAGTYDEEWQTKRFPLLPADYDPRCLRCAPSDQQVSGYLVGGESVELVNLTPRGRLQFILPKEALSFETYFGPSRKEHIPNLVSVVIESQGPRLIQVWQTSLRCGKDEDYLDTTVIRRRERSK